ncbi:MAG: thiamine-phosphate kinase [Pseudomonadota bacterium]
MNEFEIIQRYFKQPTTNNNVIVGIGDDAAVINIPKDKQLVLCMDTLVSGIHFPIETKPEDIAYKSLAVNLSDMAAMGATPSWITLSLTIPENDLQWIEIFAKQFHALANEYALSLIGGDLSRGPMSVTVQLQGLITPTCSLLRSGAKPGDDIYVSGTLGAAAFALKSLIEPQQWGHATNEELLRLNRPKPRLTLSQKLLGNATSCIDISDGLVADLLHVLHEGNIGAEVIVDKLPISTSIKKLDRATCYELALTGGDDYELCFTLPELMSSEAIEQLNQVCPITKIGKIIEQKELVLKNSDDEKINLPKSGYKHF